MSDTFDSTDDERTVNNTFRTQYRTLDPLEKELIDDIKACAAAMEALIDDIGGDGQVQRCKAIAKTNLEQAVMWAVKAITY